MEKLHVALGYYGKLVVESVGWSGGLCMLWSSKVVAELLIYLQAHIDVRVRLGCGRVWRLSGFYGHRDSSQRVHSWTLIRRLAGMSPLPWICLGDFNEVMCDAEKQGGGIKDWKRMFSKWRSGSLLNQISIRRPGSQWRRSSNVPSRPLISIGSETAAHGTTRLSPSLLLLLHHPSATANPNLYSSSPPLKRDHLTKSDLVVERN
ncbi:hypothetical protein LWI28_002303 [Acer negundo]|uniref:Endonuclease/exonuclease/phosphatase domain-containing protein n=1 Tax=Acer negundo TaxID=4023 RepID=A0AAD5IBN0_ACENE|nr:hypothetical protein LWI28_002303 [Acer negundo]